MVETAIVLSTMLLMLFGGLQIALAGYYQVAADGAVYLAAHYYALGGTDPTQISGPFPGIDLSQISFATALPDPVQEPVDYGYSNSSARYGGAQMIRPAHLQASYSTSVNGLLNILGFNAFPITAGAVEGLDWTANTEFNVAGVNPNSSQTLSGMINPFLTEHGNVPPYYVPFDFMLYCPIDDWSWDGSTCTDPDPGYFLALGLAEYLDSANYQAPNNGVGTQATFRAMLCHQQVYANLLIDGGVPGISGIALPPTMPIYDPANDLYRPYIDGYQYSDGYPNANSNASPSPIGYFAQVYNWGNYQPTGWNSGPPVGSRPILPRNGCSP